LLGTYIDQVFTKDGNIYRALVNIGGVQFTVLCVVILAATLTPQGALSFNPDIINNEKLTGDDGGPSADVELQRGDGGEFVNGVGQQQHLHHRPRYDTSGRSDHSGVSTEISMVENKEKPIRSTDIGAMIG
ncbi:hypothetical protein FRC17_002027, partial [Serendipita sp. 399]